MGQTVKDATLYSLTGCGAVRATTMCLNGKPLMMGKDDEFPSLEGISVSGTIEPEPGSCSFIVM